MATMTDALNAQRAKDALAADAAARGVPRSEPRFVNTGSGVAAKPKAAGGGTSGGFMDTGRGVRIAGKFGVPTGGKPTPKPTTAAAEKPKSAPSPKSKPKAASGGTKAAKPKKGSVGAASNREMPGRGNSEAVMASIKARQGGKPRKLVPDGARTASKPSVGPGGGADRVLAHQRGDKRGAKARAR